MSSLSHPGIPGRSLVVKTIVDTYSREVLDGAFRYSGTALSETDGILDVISAFIENGGGWSPPFASFEANLRAGDAEAILVTAAQLAVWAHDYGITGSWHASFSNPVCLRLGESAVAWLTDIAVESTTSGYEVRGRCASGELRKWSVNQQSPAGGHRLRKVDFDSSGLRLSCREDIPCLSGSDFLVKDNWNISADMDQAVDELSAAESFLRMHGGHYLCWCAGLLRQVVFTAPGKGLLESGSCRSLPGFINVSHGSPLAIAEMLTHELSHQHYYLGTRLGPVDDGTDAALYWSPVKRTGRPIANILLAYHAFGNVVLLMRGFLDSRAEPRSEIAANEAKTVGQLIELQRALEKTRALTDVGLCLYEPLRDALDLN
jgi:HEXXH motif-containing protein